MYGWVIALLILILYCMRMPIPENLPAVYTDLVTLGLVNRDRTLEMDGPDVVRAVTATRRIGDSRAPRHPELWTSFGKMLHETMAAGIDFGAHDLVAKGQFYGCGDAEGHIVRNIMSGGRGFAPIIVIDGDVPIAITKGLGEPTTYGLRDSPEHGLIAKTISLPDQLIDPRFLPNDVPANVIPLDESEHYTPLRFAMTALPGEAKVPALASHYRDSALLEHSAIVMRAEHLARVGRLLSERQIEEAIEATALELQKV